MGHGQLVRRKWTLQRPRIEGEIEALIVRLVCENPRLGYDKIQGELLKLGYQVDPITYYLLSSAVAVPGGPFFSIIEIRC